MRKVRKSSRRLGNPVKRHFNDSAGKVVYFHFTCAIVRAGMFLQTDKTVLLGHTIKINFITFPTVDLEIPSIYIFNKRVWD